MVTQKVGFTCIHIIIMTLQVLYQSSCLQYTCGSVTITVILQLTGSTRQHSLFVTILVTPQVETTIYAVCHHHSETTNVRNTACEDVTYNLSIIVAGSTCIHVVSLLPIWSPYRYLGGLSHTQIRVGS